jgi:hypothetical protein
MSAPVAGPTDVVALDSNSQRVRWPDLAGVIATPVRDYNMGFPSGIKVSGRSCRI